MLQAQQFQCQCRNYSGIKKHKMPGTLTYPMYAGVESSPHRPRSYTWNSQHRSIPRVSQTNRRPGRVSLPEPVVCN